MSSSQSTMSVSGTSTLHDWKSDVESISGSGQVTLENNEITEISGYTVTIPVESIKSGKKKMDKKTFQALKQAEHPNIQYSVKSFTRKTANSLNCQGSLTIAGKTKPISMEVKYQLSTHGLFISGELSLLMSDFDIAPPRAMAGTIKTGDKITISYIVLFTQSAQY